MAHDSGPLVKPTALITRARGGIGRTTFEVFHGAGWTVFAVDRKQADDFPPMVGFRSSKVSSLPE